MRYTDAQFWADTINTLLGGHRVAFIDARANSDWQPDTKIATLEDAHAFEYTHASDMGSFNISSSYGVHSALDRIHISADDREIVMYSDHAAGGQAMWRVLRDLECSDNYFVWLKARDASWKREDETRVTS